MPFAGDVVGASVGAFIGGEVPFTGGFVGIFVGVPLCQVQVFQGAPVWNDLLGVLVAILVGGPVL